MENKDTKADKREYTIKIIPHQGADVKSIRLPVRWLKYGAASLVAGALLFVGAFGYSAYSSYSLRSEAAQIDKLQQVNNIQQEQLLQLSKKASQLQDEVEQLGQIEQELRQITGVEGDAAGLEPAGNNGDGTHDGQGGPFGQQLKIENVTEALANLEQRVAERKASLQQLKEVMKEKQLMQEYQASVNASTPSIWPCSGDVSSPYG